MSDEADNPTDNLVRRSLRELRAHIDGRFDRMQAETDDRFVKVEAHLTDLRGLVLDTRAKMATHADVEALGHRLDVESNQVNERLAALERRIAELERRKPS